MHLRPRRLLRHVPGKPVQLLERLQTGDSASIFNTIAKEGRQNLDLLSREVLRRQRFYDRGEVRDGLPPYNWILIVDIFTQGLHHFDQGRLSVLNLFSRNR